ncbi:hypothetical protein [Neptunicella marina]|uniref:Haemolysin activator HlyB C-terminal domain-containing protein n=1 Tax=Neptunicella marina TaxID=2125989 RepID=A0A8J6IY92_9ALTE|nr:hypothetical protein [Neptunicella marina]MBC3767550.1 hypothetical protein [Neptunicella marina]
MVKHLILVVGMVAVCPLVAVADSCNSVPEIEVKTNNIFDLTDPDTIWLHRLANSINVVTRQSTIENELAFLNEKCDVSERDLREVERHLRQLKYIKTAEASFNDEGNILVETSDKWTMMPTLDFGRKGGKNKYSIGLKDRNLFGYGIDADIEYFKNDQRTGYTFKSEFPLYLGQNIHGGLILSDTDDGSAQGISIIKPFVSYDTNTAYSFDAYHAKLSQQFYLNGADYYELAYTDTNFSASWGQLLSRQPDSVWRYQVGVDATDRQFTGITSIFDINQPDDRRYLVPFVQIDYIQDAFAELNNIHVINQIEDFNFGWQLSTKLGVNVAARNNDESRFIWNLNASKGTQLSNNTLLFSDFSLESDFGSSSKNRFVVKSDNELFYRLSDRFSLYGGQFLTLSKNQYLDAPVAIGEETGVRGYPLEFQRGDHKISFTGELRYYPNINIYNLFELGAAAFVDTGKAFSTNDFHNDTNQWLTSVGIGARLFSKHSSDAKVIHIDMSFPMLNHQNVNNVEFLITTRTSF